MRTNPQGAYVRRQLATLRPRGELLDFGSGWGWVLHEAGRAGWARVEPDRLNDGVREPDEVFTVHLARPRGWGRGRRDDDARDTTRRRLP